MDELPADFMSLIATFAGRRYGIGSGQARQRLLAKPASDTGGHDRGGVGG
jgi:hypothetical protein